MRVEGVSDDGNGFLFNVQSIKRRIESLPDGKFQLAILQTAINNPFALAMSRSGAVSVESSLGAKGIQLKINGGADNARVRVIAEARPGLRRKVWDVELDLYFYAFNRLSDFLSRALLRNTPHEERLVSYAPRHHYHRFQKELLIRARAADVERYVELIQAVNEAPPLSAESDLEQRYNYVVTNIHLLVSGSGYETAVPDGLEPVSLPEWLAAGCQSGVLVSVPPALLPFACPRLTQQQVAALVEKDGSTYLPRAVNALSGLLSQEAETAIEDIEAHDWSRYGGDYDPQAVVETEAPEGDDIKTPDDAFLLALSNPAALDGLAAYGGSEKLRLFWLKQGSGGRSLTRYSHLNTVQAIAEARANDWGSNAVTRGIEMPTNHELQLLAAARLAFLKQSFTIRTGVVPMTLTWGKI